MSRKKVLVIDDEKDLAQLIKMNLEDTGLYEVNTALDGKKGLEKVKSQKYDLIFTDFVMPGLNGVETCKAIRVISPASKLVIITGKFHEEPQWKDFCYSGEDGKAHSMNKAFIEKEIGEAFFLYKPFTKEELVEFTKRMFEEKE